ncbi:arylamine N-acetyltransferase [Bradyrhizobium arachidis]|uniref:arylamine N-acetyltransferase family protein n=1 Tax=Bradyrhizobium TaxID=374 RepID=UPI00216193B8|nr:MULTISPECIES: arylamine N-acetyltransferase [Bradyrhizobium]MDN4986448.1 arylamine N-acetyltransferase [Bradyrhizobium sp. WYCCWR 13022]UVO38220.1 arylamine N-acetyltransferase [Bradyrhizobium arachidis]
MSNEFRLSNYLARIGHGGPVRPDLATLTALHAAHVNAIPFEGLDPLLGRQVRLDLASVQAKLVDSRRGGYCFEQNALFKAALETIGFAVTGLSGRVRWMSPPESPLGPKVHMLLKVDLPEGPHIADVGFGACVMDAPLRFKTEIEQPTAMGTFRLGETNGLFSISARQPQGWRTMYVFDLEPQIQSDYELGNYFTSTSSLAPFTSTLILERVDADKRYKLANRRLTIEAREGEVRHELTIDSAHDLGQVLQETFNVELPGPTDDVFGRIGG